MVSFFFFLSFILFFLRGGGGGGKFIVNNEPVNRLLMLRGGESTPTFLPILSCDLISFPLSSRECKLQRNSSQGTRKRSEKRASKGI